MRRLIAAAAIAALYALPACAAPTAAEILAANKAASQYQLSAILSVVCCSRARKWMRHGGYAS